MPISAEQAVLGVVLAPLVAMACALLLAWPLTRRNLHLSDPAAERLRTVVTITASVVSLLLTLGLMGLIEGRTDPIEIEVLGTTWLYLDALSVFFLLLVNLIVLVASFYASHYLATRKAAHLPAHPTLFHALFNFFHLTMVLVLIVSSPVYLWIAVELTTIASTILVGFRQDRRALEAAWKYIVVTSTGIIFALVGTLLLAMAVPPGDEMNWTTLMADAPALDAGLVQLSFLFVLVGYGTKAGFAPMHTWLPDLHGEAPYPISALLSGVLLKCALYAILRFMIITNATLGGNDFTSGALLICGLFSLVLAVPLILKENSFKRVLAYHSLEHMGIIAFGLGVGTSLALFAALLHALNHAVTKALMFLTYGVVQGGYQQAGMAERGNPVGVLRAMPISGILLALGGLALVGSPPFNIFLSEFMILWASLTRASAAAASSPDVVIESAFVVAIVLFLLSLALIFGGLMRHLGRLLIDTPPQGVRHPTVAQVVPLVMLLAVVIVFGVTVPSFALFDLSKLLDASVKVIQCLTPTCLP